MTLLLLLLTLLLWCGICCCLWRFVEAPPEAPERKTH